MSGSLDMEIRQKVNNCGLNQTKCDGCACELTGDVFVISETHDYIECCNSTNLEEVYMEQHRRLPKADFTPGFFEDTSCPILGWAMRVRADDKDTTISGKIDVNLPKGEFKDVNSLEYGEMCWEWNRGWFCEFTGACGDANRVTITQAECLSGAVSWQGFQISFYYADERPHCLNGARVDYTPSNRKAKIKSIGDNRMTRCTVIVGMNDC